MGLSLGSLSGLPPSPLFFSEVLIVMGGFAIGQPASAAALASVLLALGFVGLAHVLVQDLLATGKGSERPGVTGARAFRRGHRHGSRAADGVGGALGLPA